MTSYRTMVCTFFVFLFTAEVFGQGTADHSVFLSVNDRNTLQINSGLYDGWLETEIDGDVDSVFFTNGTAEFEREISRRGELITLRTEDHSLSLYHISLKKNGDIRLVQIPLWLSILPPLVAIGLALIFKEVIISLFMGVWIGAFIASGLRVDSLYYFFLSLLSVVEKYIVIALTDAGHLSIVIFSLLIGGMVAIISRNGGMAGVVKALAKYARSPRSAQFVTWLLGVAIFFDDYANTLIVGNTMRSVTDRFRISREKLAYIVDSTAAPVAAIAFITTWIGAELGYIDGGIAILANFPFDLTPYAIFVSSLKYSFYPVLTLSFILFIVYHNRDFGPMLKAEMRARRTGRVSSAATPEEDEPNMEDLSPVEGAPMKWQHAFFPVMLVILMTIFGLVGTGMETIYQEIEASGQSLDTIGWGSIWSNMHLLFPEGDASFFRKVGRLIGSSDSYVALLWASLSGVVLAIAITLWNKTMRVIDTMHTMVTGFKTMLPALIILTLAWSLATTTEELQTATFLSSAVEGSLNPYLLPPLVFILSAAIAFSTGSSWSTMAILYPIAIPTSWVVCQSAGIDDVTSLELLLNVIATVLAASVLGDHCSPISDTTILSSLASDCNHIDHVRTQLPYALVVGIVSLVAGTLSTYFGGGWLISFLLLLFALGVLFSVVKYVGEPLPDADLT